MTQKGLVINVSFFQPVVSVGIKTQSSVERWIIYQVLTCESTDILAEFGIGYI